MASAAGYQQSALSCAEGWARGGSAELARVLSIDVPPASEPEYHLLLARDPDVATKAAQEQRDGDVTEVKRILTPLIQKLKADDRKVKALT
ncbi:MAG: four helix bundle protein [Acidobacteria bacterium]|nr:four helix bundle protein [Acidobacteriota bacterium]